MVSAAWACRSALRTSVALAYDHWFLCSQQISASSDSKPSPSESLRGRQAASTALAIFGAQGLVQRRQDPLSAAKKRPLCRDSHQGSGRQIHAYAKQHSYAVQRTNGRPHGSQQFQIRRGPMRIGLHVRERHSPLPVIPAKLLDVVLPFATEQEEHHNIRSS